MPIFSLPGLELARFRRALLTRLALVAVLVVPLIYGGLYLTANLDPTHRLSDLPAAVVDQDVPVRVSTRAEDGSTGERTVSAGADLVRTLESSTTSFGWESASAAEAADGLRDGRFAAVLTIPRGFSAALGSVGGDDPRSGQLTLTTDDAENYIAGTIANSVGAGLTRSLSANANQNYAEQVSLAFGSVHTSLGQAADGAARLRDGAAEATTGADSLAAGAGDLATGAGRLADGAGQAQAGADRLADGLAELQGATASLPGDSSRLAQGAAGVADGARRLEAGTRQLQQALAAVPDPQLQQQLTALVEGAGQLSGGAGQVADGTAAVAERAPALTTGIAQATDGARSLASGDASLAAGAGELQAGAGRLQTGAQDLAGGTERLRSGAEELRSSLAGGQAEVPDDDAGLREQRAATVATPVSTDRVREHEVARYSDGLAPLFVCVALWVGGMVTYMVLRAMSPRALASTVAPWRAALAGWLPGAVLAVGQALVLGLVLHLAVGIAAPNLPGALAFSVLVALVFTAIHQCLNALLGGVGRLLALVLLVLQLTSAGGTYPVQTSPGFFAALHPWLPMTYGVDGIRHLVAGGSAAAVWTDAAALAGFGLLALAVSVLAAARRRTWTPARLHPSLTL
ncbi:YhgE/Pip family protein [Kineococcus gynurae]|uniref:YhgE/Pip family protein n=1 Tax=Kineococcus gynurae TaxID=452979 RepID=A0ABV5LUA3_9ACTN